MEIVHSEYVSPCSPIVLQRWGHEAKQDPESEGQRAFLATMLMRGVEEPQNGRWRALLRRWTSKGSDQTGNSTDTETHIEICVVPSDCGGEVAKTKEGLCVMLPPTAETDLNPSITSTGNVISSNSSTAPFLASTSTECSQTNSLSFSASSTPSSPGASTPFPTLFSQFPRSHITVGTAERLTREVSSLFCAMEKDGVDVSVHWARDACHDILILPSWWWDQEVVEEVWESVTRWAEGFHD